MGAEGIRKDALIGHIAVSVDSEVPVDAYIDPALFVLVFGLVVFHVKIGKMRFKAPACCPGIPVDIALPAAHVFARVIFRIAVVRRGSLVEHRGTRIPAEILQVRALRGVQEFPDLVSVHMLEGVALMLFFDLKPECRVVRLGELVRQPACENDLTGLFRNFIKEPAFRFPAAVGFRRTVIRIRGFEELRQRHIRDRTQHSAGCSRRIQVHGVAVFILRFDQIIMLRRGDLLHRTRIEIGQHKIHKDVFQSVGEPCSGIDPVGSPFCLDIQLASAHLDHVTGFIDGVRIRQGHDPVGHVDPVLGSEVLRGLSHGVGAAS